MNNVLGIKYTARQRLIDHFDNLLVNNAQHISSAHKQTPWGINYPS